MAKQRRPEPLRRPRVAAAPPPRLPAHAVAGALLIALLITVAYSPSLQGRFLLDDDKLLTENSLIKASDGVYRFWLTTEHYDYWPVSNTVLWLEWRLWGAHPTGYRIVNLVLHVVEAWLVWAILARLAVPGAFVAALLFAVHPVNVETVAWIAQCKSLLAMLFSLLSTLFFLKSEARTALPGRPSPPVPLDRWYWLSVLAFVSAMLSKVSAAVLPPILLGAVLWRRSLTRRDLARIAPFVVIAVVLVPVNLWFRTHGAESAVSTATLVDRVLGAAAAVWFYLSKALLPVNLIFTYPAWHVDADAARWWLPLIAAGATTGVLWAYRRTWGRPVLFAWAYFCLALVPVLGFTDVGFKQHIVVADHYQHTALIGVVALAAAAWALWQRHAPATRSWAPYAAAGAVVGILTFLTWRQSGLYVDAATLYQDTLRRNPDAWMARTNLGAILSKTGRSEEAIAHFKQALVAKPDYPEAHSNLGRELVIAGNLREAIAHYQEALRANPHFAEAHNNLGEALSRNGELDAAIEQYQLAVRLKPDLATPHNNICNALVQKDRPREALPYCARALQLAPEFPEAHYNLGNIFFLEQAFQPAIDQFELAVRYKPDYAAAHNNLGSALAQLGRHAEAIDHYQRALRIDPNFAEAQRNLAATVALQHGTGAAGGEGSPR